MIKRLMLFALVLVATACSDSTKVEIIQRAVKIESADECHLCGMIISNFPGPKGELYSKGQDQVHKFCSTRDLFAYYLQPENTHRVQQIFVHNMAITPWGKPEDNIFVDARKAYYVIEHGQQGAMGPTLASFEDVTEAQLFIEQYGGRVIGFSEVTLALLSELTLLAAGEPSGEKD